ncbi:MDR family MFS transporter [Listeria goaensis]|uniref:MDR family MFS transporter n=1 Tax=Listeria goaensis TaxID=1649188 RepID=UPI000B597C82|nr:MFS transporter [Listeria goaensis]
MFRALHPNIRMRIVINFFSKIIASMIFPFLAIYFTAHFNPSVAGILLMLNIAIPFVVGLYGGHLADVLGRRKLMVTGEVLKMISYLGLVLVNSALFSSPLLTFVFLLLIGIAQGIINPAADAMLIDVSTPESRSFMYSISYWANNLSSMIGIIIGGWLFTTHFFELLIALFLMSILTTWLTFHFITETHKQDSSKSSGTGIKEVFNAYSDVVRDKSFVLFTISGIFIMTIEFQRNNFISVRLADEFQNLTLQLGQLLAIPIDGVRILSLLTALNTLCIVLFTAPVAKWLIHRKNEPVMYVGFLLFAVGFSFSAFLSNMWLLFFATLLLSLGEFLYVPTRQTILAAIINDNKRGAYMAFNGIIFQVGKLFGAASLLFAPLIGKYGMGVFIIVCGALACIFGRLALRKKQVLLAENESDSLESGD